MNKGIFKYSRKNTDTADKQCLDFLKNNYDCTEEDAIQRTEKIKEICVDVMNKLLLTQIKIETRADLVNLIKQYNTVSNAKIIEYLEKEFE